MKNDDIRSFMNHLQDATAKLPLYRADLRRRLMTIHPGHPGRHTIRRASRRAKSSLPKSRVTTGSRQSMRIGLVITMALIALLGLLMMLPTASSGSKRKLVDTHPSATSVPDQLSTRSRVFSEKSTSTTEKSSAVENNTMRGAEITPTPTTIPQSASAPLPSAASSAPPASAAPESERAAISISSNDPEDPNNSPGNSGQKKDKVPGGDNANKKNDKANGNQPKGNKNAAQPPKS